MRAAILILMLSAFSVPAHAQQSIESLCNKIKDYVPVDGVEFEPGKSEVPADIQSLQHPVLGTISIPVEIDLAEYFDRPSLRAMPGLMLEPDVSYIEINQNGDVYYNGQEISDDINRVCGGSVKVEKDSGVEPEVVSDVTPSVAPPVPKVKPDIVKKPVEAADTKSRVKVFNGPKAIITNNADPVEESASAPPLKLDRTEVEDKAIVDDENAIDVEDLKAQDNGDSIVNNDDENDSILEGQYP